MVLNISIISILLLRPASLALFMEDRMLTRGLQLHLSLFLALMTVGCSSAPEKQVIDESNAVNGTDSTANIDETHPSDPFESFNRAMWDINYDYLDPYLVRPVSVAYVEYVPHPIRLGIINVLANLDEPSSMVNNLVMGNGEQAVNHFNRFWINTTFGLVGLIDIASEAGIPKNDDKAFSDALGHYGVGNGPYLMLPGYGPYTVREVTDTVDGMYVPLSYLNVWAGLGKWALEGMEKRVQLIPQEGQLKTSPDPYALSREVFLQRQDFKAEINTTTEIDEDEEAYLDEYLDEEF